jgi:hypothetical protein
VPQEQIRVVAIEHEFHGGQASALVRFLSGKCLTDDSMILDYGLERGPAGLIEHRTRQRFQYSLLVAFAHAGSRAFRPLNSPPKPKRSVTLLATSLVV